MTNAELIKALRYCISDEYVEKGCLICPICAPRQGEMKCNSQDDAIKYAADALEAADAALEKQIPKKAVGTHYANMRCPSCGKRIPSGQGSSSRRRDNWCNYCGQKIDWGEHND